MLPETSAVFVDVVEHPTRVPTTTTAKKGKHNLSVSIFYLSFDIGQFLFAAREGPNASGWSPATHQNAQTNGHGSRRLLVRCPGSWMRTGWQQCCPQNRLTPISDQRWLVKKQSTERNIRRDNNETCVKGVSKFHSRKREAGRSPIQYGGASQHQRGSGDGQRRDPVSRLMGECHACKADHVDT